MSGEFETLLLIFFGIYIMECLAWVPENDVLFLSWSGRKAKIFGPGLWLKNPVPLGYALRVKNARQNNEKKSLDVKNFQNQWDRFEKTIQPLAWLGRVLFAVALPCMGLLFLGPKAYGIWVGCLGIFLVLHLCAAPLLWRVHRALYPALTRERWMSVVICVMSPWQSVRSVDGLWPPLVAGVHPLTVALHVLDKQRFRAFAQKYLLNLHYLAVTEGPSQENVEKEESLLVPWLKSVGLAAEELLRPPVPRDPSSRSFCERCRSEYVLVQGRCSDCGRTLAPF